MTVPVKHLNEVVVVTGRFRVAGVLTDQVGAVDVDIDPPIGASSTAVPAHPSTGTYTVELTLNRVGVWRVHMAGDNTEGHVAITVEP